MIGKLLNRFREGKKHRALLSRYCSFAPGVITTDLKLEIRKPVDKTFLSVGDNSIIQARFVFENDNGLIEVGANSFIGSSTFICTNRISIGNDVLISWGCTFADNDSHSIYWKKREMDVKNWRIGIMKNSLGHYKDWTYVKCAPISIADKAWIGFNVIILKGVSIGEGSVVAAGSVVTKDVPSWSLVAGNPARIIKRIDSDDLGANH